MYNTKLQHKSTDIIAQHSICCRLLEPQQLVAHSQPACSQTKTPASVPGGPSKPLQAACAPADETIISSTRAQMQPPCSTTDIAAVH